MLQLVLLLLPSAALAADDDVESLEQEAFRAAVARVAPSVVRIETIGGVDRVGKTVRDAGVSTGVIIDADGLIVTSTFALAGRPSSVLVVLPDGTRRAARRLATDFNRMLVLLAVDTPNKLPVPEAAPAESIRPGQWAVALGKTFPGDQPHIAVGIISAKRRIWNKAIQTDAAVSSGNFGGPLLDIHGRVLGLLVPMSPDGKDAMAGLQWYDSGIGFAVPWHEVQSLLPRLATGEDLHPGVAGIGFGRENVHAGEPMLRSVHPNSPARDAGLAVGDRILDIAGQLIRRPADAKLALGPCHAGQTVSFRYERDGTEHETELTLAAKLEPYEHPFLGILPIRWPVTRVGQEPVTVRYVYPESPAATAGIEPGDTLRQLDDARLVDADQLRQAVDQARPGQTVKLSVGRGDTNREVEVTLGRLPESVPSDDPLPTAWRDVPTGPVPDDPPTPETLKISELPQSAEIHVPRSHDPAVASGLLVWLGDPKEPKIEAMARQWRATAHRDRLILLFPLPRDERWQPEDAEFVGKLLAKVEGEYVIDSTRIVVCGEAAGAALAWMAWVRHRDLVRGIAAVRPARVLGVPENAPERRLAFFVTRHGNGPNANPPESDLKQLRAARYPVTVHELAEQAKGLDASGYSLLARWMDTLDRI